MILSCDHMTSLTIMKIDIYWSERVYGGRGGPLLESPGNLTYPEQYFNIKILKREKLVRAPKVVYSVSLNKSVFSQLYFKFLYPRPSWMKTEQFYQRQ